MAEVKGVTKVAGKLEGKVSDDARYVTGVTLPVDAGFTNKK